MVGGSPIVGCNCGTTVNLRHLPLALRVNELIRGKFFNILSHIMNDERFCLVWHSLISKPKGCLLLCGMGIMLSWSLVSLQVYYFIGSAIPDPKTFGLDAIFPAILIVALTFSALKNKVTQKAVFAGSTLALITTPF